MVSVYYALMLEYRAEILLWALAGLLPLMLMGVWMKAAASGAATQGKTPEDFARYFMTVFIIGQFTTVWVIYDFEYDVVEGRLSPWLLQPIDPGWRYLASHAGERLTRLPWVIAMIVVFFLLYPKALWVPSLRSVALCISAVALAFTLRFAMQYAFSMLGFWVERAGSIEQLTFILFIFLSGRIAPLELYPESVARFAQWTPFPYVVYFPTTLLLDPHATPWPGFAIMLGWIAFFAGLQRLLWRRGLKHYSAMGA
jgi:ABC-2 type transport system permease protein